METFSARIKAVRAKLDLSQEEAAKSWGFSVPTLRAWEQEVRRPIGLYKAKLERTLRRLEEQPAEK